MVGLESITVGLDVVVSAVLATLLFDWIVELCWVCSLLVESVDLAKSEYIYAQLKT
jgi:hypothetical protein